MLTGSEVPKTVLDSAPRRFFRDAFREARAVAHKDAEGFDQIVHVLERLGTFLRRGGIGKVHGGLGLGASLRAANHFAGQSPLADDLALARPDFHQTFGVLYEQVRDGRNHAVHEGAIARHLTGDAIILALILEDALMADSKTIGDYMIRLPVRAELWQPLSFIRQIMLVNSFSHLPVYRDNGSGGWQLVSDGAVARFTRVTDRKERLRRLALTLDEACRAGLVLVQGPVCSPNTTIEEALAKNSDLPILVTSGEDNLLGLLTPFDLL
jgi:CBS domain-containing protein